MKVSIIAAVSENGVIGKDGDLPWHLPNDLKRFQDLTTGKPIIMGRKTYESIGMPLPDRVNIVVTSNRDYGAPGCKVVTSPETAILAAFNVVKDHDRPEAFVIGGSRIYKEFLPVADRIYLTRVRSEIEGDTFFPDVFWENWRLINREEHESDEDHEYPYAFLTYKRLE